MKTGKKDRGSVVNVTRKSSVLVGQLEETTCPTDGEFASFIGAVLEVGSRAKQTDLLGRVVVTEGFNGIYPYRHH